MSQSKLDRILEEAGKQVQGDVAALLGASFELSPFSSTIKTKEDCFADLMGKQAFSHVDVSGEINDKAGLIINVRDAVFLGATLVMIPDSEIEELVSREEYNEEIDDSYGEIANIIIGSISKVFEENFPTSCRLVRKETEVISPLKIDCDSDALVPNQEYYLATGQIKVGEKDLGDISIMLPASSFGIEVDSGAVDSSVEGASESIGDNSTTEAEVASVEEPNVPVLDPVEVVTPEEREKIKKRLDTLLEESFNKMGGEIGMLLGVEASVVDLQNKVVSKENFFLDEVQGKRVISEFDMTGSIAGACYFDLSIRDAIHLGGVLIMLPPSELENVVNEEDFDEDAEDAYGEIANIISGVYTSVFEEQHSSGTRFIRKEMTRVMPMKVDTASDAPFPDQDYYVSSMQLVVNEQDLGRINFLLPAMSFGVLASQEEEVAAQNTSAREPSAVSGNGNSQQAGQPQMGGSSNSDIPVNQVVDGQQQQGDATTQVANEQIVGDAAAIGQQVSSSHVFAPVQEGQTYDVLVVSNEAHETGKIIQILQEKGYVVGQLGYNDSLNSYISQQLKAIYIVMDEVSEQAFGVAIKISTGSDALPLIAVGPSWTRSKVIKAVKYGVKDILLSPTMPDDISDNISRNIEALAA
ncbi:MAG: hypothetical protein OCC45_06835 [Desulfotalea sp.]